MVPIDALGYNHFVIFRVLWAIACCLRTQLGANRTMTINKFNRVWLDYGKDMGHVGFVVKRVDGVAPLSRMSPEPVDFVMFN
jgi:hypothetical protein